MHLSRGQHLVTRCVRMRFAEVADDHSHSENMVGSGLRLVEYALGVCRVFDAMGQPLSSGPPQYGGVTQMSVRARVDRFYRVIRFMSRTCEV